MSNTNPPLILAHRGVTRYAPENSIEAIQKAVELGLHGIELDLRQTSDNQFVCFHDENVKRLTGVDKKISEMGSTHLRQLTLEAPSPDGTTSLSGRVAFLEDVLDLVSRDFLLNIEIKGPSWKTEDLQDKMIVPLRQRGLMKHALISSFFPIPLLRIKKIEPTIRIGILVHDTHLHMGKPGWMSRFLSPYSIHPEFHLATPGRIALWKDAGYAIFVWTVNDRETYDKFCEAEVNGVITDIPETLSEQPKD